MTIVAQPKRVKLTFEPNTLIATVGQPLPAFVVAPPVTYTTADKVAAERERVRAENARAELMKAARSAVGLPHSKADKAMSMRALPRPPATLTQVQALPGTLEVHLAYEIDSTPVPLDAGLPPYAPGPRVALVKRVTARERAAAIGASRDGVSQAASGGQLDEEDERRSVESPARSTLGTKVKEASKENGNSRRSIARSKESASGPSSQVDVVLDSEGEEEGMIPTRTTAILRKGMNAALVTPPRPKSGKAATAVATPPPAKRAKVSVPSPEAEDEAPALAVGGKAKAGPAQAKGVPQRRAPARAVNTAAGKTGKVAAQGGKTAVLRRVLSHVMQAATQQASASASAGQEDDFVFEE